MAESRAPAGDLEEVLEDLRSLSGEVTSAAVVLGSGELGASTLASGVDEQRYAAMLAALAGLARRTGAPRPSRGRRRTQSPPRAPAGPPARRPGSPPTRPVPPYASLP